MIEEGSIPTQQLIRSLRILAADTADPKSPFKKDEAYFHNLSGWLACAATRLEEKK
jgi:hypothetical protein